MRIMISFKNKYHRSTVLTCCSVSAVLMGLAVLSSCSDWDDHYEANKSATSTQGETLLQNIEKNDQLTQFADLLKKTGYDKNLAASQTFTVWAPKDGSFDYNKLQGYDSERLQREFVENHIARNNYPASGAFDMDVYMLNEKRMHFGGTTSYDIQGVKLTDPNLWSSNGVMHLIDGQITYLSNIYESLNNYDEYKLDSISKFIHSFDEKEIDDLKDFVARNKARVSTRNMAMSRQKKLDKMDVIELQREKPKPEFNFKEARKTGKVVFETNDLVIGYDNVPLSKPINLRMERGEKIAVIGTNGIGKSTFLKSVLGIIEPVSGKATLGDYLSIGYFEQESKMSDNSCIEEIWEEFPSYTQYEVRSALAKCGLTTKHIESLVRVLSGGEQAKVRLCKLINRETNILLLDEPTNHLDTDAKDELKRALKEYGGSVLLVCHEPEFYSDIVDKIWNIEEYSLLSV